MSQKSQIRRRLLDGAIVTQKMAARDFNCWRLADVIWKLRKGSKNFPAMEILTETREAPNGARFAAYRLRNVEPKRAGRPRKAAQ